MAEGLGNWIGMKLVSAVTVVRTRRELHERVEFLARRRSGVLGVDGDAVDLISQVCVFEPDSLVVKAEVAERIIYC